MADDGPHVALPVWATWNYSMDHLPESFHSLDGFKLVTGQFSIPQEAIAGNWTFLLGIGLALRDVDRVIEERTQLFAFESLLTIRHLDGLLGICMKYVPTSHRRSAKETYAKQVLEGYTYCGDSSDPSDHC
jgi:hypothetical protein